MAGSYVFFHKPEEENGFLSNWYLSDMEIDDMLFTSVEQYMMYIKAITFRNKSIADKIMSTNDVAEIKRLGRSVRGYIDSVWAAKRQDVVRKAVRRKFECNERLMKKFLEYPKDSVFAECAVNDRIWGIGISMNDFNRLNPSNWKGKNLLGKIYMEYRKELA